MQQTPPSKIYHKSTSYYKSGHPTLGFKNIDENTNEMKQVNFFNMFLLLVNPSIKLLSTY
jgi:hypothetical protein